MPLLRLAFLLVLLPAIGCATPENKQLTWDEAETSTGHVTASAVKRSAADFHSDDACVAESERLLPRDKDAAQTLMRGCLHRDDFMLVSRLAEKQWKPLKLERKDWDAVMRAELRRGGIAELNLAPYGLPSEWLRSLDGNASPERMFLLYGEAVGPRERAGKPGLVVHPIIYGTRDEILAYQQHWDLVQVDRTTGRETVIQKNAKVTTEHEKTGRTQQTAQVVKQPIYLEMDGHGGVKKGDGLLCIVDKVRVGQKAKGIVYDDGDAPDDEQDQDEEEGKPQPIRYIAHVVTCVPSSG